MTYRALESICAKLQASLDPCKPPEKDEQMDLASSLSLQRKNKRKSAAPIRSAPLAAPFPAANMEEGEIKFQKRVSEELKKEDKNIVAPDSKKARSSNDPSVFQSSAHRPQQSASGGVTFIESILSQEIVNHLLLKAYEQTLEHVSEPLSLSKNLGNDLPSRTSSINTGEGTHSPSESTSEYDQHINDVCMDNMNDTSNDNHESMRSNGSSGKIRLFKGKQSLFSSGADSSVFFDTKTQRFSNAEKCGRDLCISAGLRDHYHCSVCDTVVCKRDDMIRHLKWHKKRDESLQHGFMRYCPTEDCASHECAYNRKQTHYHCIRKNCEKVYISTSDVQMHANYHRKDAAIVQEGFQRFRATENCASESCAFFNERTTHFHCQREGCTFTFKNKADMDKHKSHHQKNDDYSRDGFKKFMKYEACCFADCKFSKQMNHIHCIRSSCDYVVHSSSQILSHKRKHQRRLDSIAVDAEAALSFNDFIVNKSDSMHSEARCANLPTSSTKALSMSSDMKSEDEDDENNDSSDEVQLNRMSASHNEEICKMAKGIETFDSNANVELNNDGSMALTLPRELETDDDYDDECEAGNDCWQFEKICRLIFQNVDQLEKQTAWNSLMQRYTANDRCVALCDKMYKDHYHCIVKHCAWTARAKDKIREHTRNHFQDEEVTRHIFKSCEKPTNPACPLEPHLHCLYNECNFISTEKDPFMTRLTHFKVHDLHHSISHKKKPMFTSRQVSLDTLNSSGKPHENSTLSLPTNSFSSPNGNSEAVGALFAASNSAASSKRRGRPPKLRDQIVVPRCVVKEEHLLTMDKLFEGNLTREMFLASSESFFSGLRLYLVDEVCHDEQCVFNKVVEHYHCCLPRCYYSSDKMAEVNLHIKEFHRNVHIFDGFEYYDNNVNCRRLQCHYNGRNKHYHCVRDNCDYCFLRHNTMRAHLKKHEDDGIRREYFQNKSSASLTPTMTACAPNHNLQQQMSELRQINSTVRAAGTYFPSNTSSELVTSNAAKDLASQLFLNNMANMPMLSLPAALMRGALNNRSEEEIDAPLDLSSRKVKVEQNADISTAVKSESQALIDFSKLQVLNNNNSSNFAMNNALPHIPDVKEAGLSALMACFVYENGRGYCRNVTSCVYALSGQEHMHCRICAYGCVDAAAALEHLTLYHNPPSLVPSAASKSQHALTNNTTPLVIIPLATPVTSSVLQQQ